jgi:mitochondrial fission protein ELM1
MHMNIWLIDVGLPGHTMQVESVAHILEQRLHARGEWIHAHQSVRGGTRGFAKRMINWIPLPLVPAWMDLMYCDFNLPAYRPDLILTSGSGTISFCRLLKRLTGAPAVFLGEAHPPRSGFFELIVAPVTLGLDHELLAPLTQTGRTPEQASEASLVWWPAGVPPKCWTMIIGGDGKAHTYEPDEWVALGHAMNEAARKAGIRWLITTSRRTGAGNEHLLRETLDPALIAEAIWWADSPQKGLMAMVGAGQRVFATRDSLTMISEVIAAKGRVEVVRPRTSLLKPDTVYERYLKRLENEGLLVSHRIHSLAESDQTMSSVSIRERQAVFEEELVARIKALVTH